MPKKAAEPEAPEFVEIPYKGSVFVIPKDRGDWSTEGLAYLAEEKYNLFVKHTLEMAVPGQWEAVVHLCPRRKDFADFFTVFGQATKECTG